MKKVVVGLSGGVDSSVAAYLLKEQGYDVQAVFMKNWDPALNGDLADPFIDQEICQSALDYQDAQAVAEKLGIPITLVDFVDEYWNKVFEYFLQEYSKARTPNPDILCNKYIKFHEFLKYAQREFDCDYIAMGHYAQVEHEPTVKLIRGLDENKDQTYFLSQLSTEQLSKTLFPIGHLQKSEVREIATKLGLVTADKKDSTGICFIGERNFMKFLTSYIKPNPGIILDIETNVQVGEHKGLMYYTAGQRRGLGIGGHKQFPNVKWYVAAKDTDKNILYVANSDNVEYLYSDEVVVTNVNFTQNHDYKIKTAKFRYRSKDIEILDYEWLDETTLKLKHNIFDSVTPGQEAVFYNDEVCLGGGTIDQVFYKGELKMI